MLPEAAGLELFPNPLSTPSPVPGLACRELLVGVRMGVAPLEVGPAVTAGAGISAGDACPMSKYEDPFSGEGSGAVVGPGDGTSATGT